MVGRLAIHTFGGLSILHDDQPLSGFDSPQAKALLAFLACTGTSHLRDKLAALLWPDLAATQARVRLKSVLEDLQAITGMSLTDTEQSIGMTPDPAWWVDAVAFEKQAQVSDDDWLPREGLLPGVRQRVVSAIDLYQGEFLAGFSTGGAAFDAWVSDKRAQLHRLAVTSLDHIAADCLVRRDCEGGIARGRQLLRMDPLREESHQHMMVLLARGGQRSQALAQYEACRVLLREALGVAPTEYTTALYEKIVDGTIAPPAPDIVTRPPEDETTATGHNLPRLATTFVGRTTEIAAVRKQLSRATCRLLTLTGPGGIGKTRLALAAARTMLDSYEHGGFFVATAPLRTSEDLAPAIAEAIGFRFRQGDDPPERQLLAHLQGKHLLLVLDGLEHPPDGVELVERILQEAPQNSVLATSREALGLSPEQTFPIQGLAMKGRSEKAHEAVQLFADRACQKLPGFALSGRMKAVAAICRMLEGVPLAIELAAARIGVLSVDEIAAALEACLDVKKADGSRHHRGLRAVFACTWDSLPEADQAVFMQVSVFRGGFTREAALAVAGATLRSLMTLVDRSLLILDQETGRYDLHDLLREIAGDRLTTSGEVEALRDRHARHYIGWLEEADSEIDGPHASIWHARMAADGENLRQMLDRALEHDLAARVMPLMQDRHVLAQFWEHRRHFAEGQQWIERYLAAGGEVPAGVMAGVQMSLAWMLNLQGRKAPAQQAAAYALKMARQSEDTPQIALALLHTALASDDHQEAVRLHEEALALYREMEDQRQIAITLHNMAEYAREGRDFDRASECYAESIATLRDRSALGYAQRMGLAFVLLRQGEVQRARGIFAECLAEAHADGLPDLVQEAIVGLGCVGVASGDHQRAVPLLAAAGPVARYLNDAFFFGDLPAYEDYLAQAREQLPADAFDSLWAEGQQLSLAETIAAARASPESVA